MLKSLRKSVLAPDHDGPAAPRKPGQSAYVHTALLKCPDSVAHLGSFWDAAKLFGMAAKTGLKQVIEDAAYSDGSQTLVPHHVLVELSDSALAHDRRTGGHLSSAMARTLADLHQKDFAAKLPADAHPSYRVVAASDVPPGSARVRLGPAVHVALSQDPPAWQVQLSRDGTWWDELAPITLYEQQRLFILSGSADHGTQVCPDWPFEATTGLVMLNLPGEPELELSAEPLRSLDISRHAQANWTVVRRPGAEPGDAALYLRIRKLLPPAAQPTRANHPVEAPTAPQPSSVIPTPARVPARTASVRMEPRLDDGVEPTPPADPSAIDDGPTLVVSAARDPHQADCGDDAPTLLAVSSQPAARLALRGLALQRPSMFAGAGVQGLCWALDKQGQVVPPDHPAAAVRFELNAQDALLVHTRSGPRPLTLGDAVPLPGSDAIVQTHSLPQELLHAYVGWLDLPAPREMRLQAARDYVVGRQAEDLKPLRPLAAPGHLGALPDVGGDRMGLSRRHAELRLTEDGLVVHTLGKATAIHLNADMQFVGIASADQPAVLPSGHHLVLGHYLWRFIA